jgi:hypothetical protein
MASGFWSPLAIGAADGPTITASGALTCLPVTARFTFPPNAFAVGSMLRLSAQGRISCVVTTPGTALFDLRLNNNVIFSTSALALNTTAKTTVPWWLDITLTCRAIGATGNFMGFARFTSSAYLASGTGAAGGIATVLDSVVGGPDSAPAVGSNVDLTAANPFEFFFTQNVATGSFTVHQFLLESGGIALT